MLSFLPDFVLDLLSISEGVLNLSTEDLLVGLDVREDLLGVTHVRHLA